MLLFDAQNDKKLKIVDINSGIDIKRKLLSIGIHPEDSLIKLNYSNWGAVMVQNLSNGSTMVALGKSLAKQIVVDYEL